MKKYQQPLMNSESVEYANAAGQYIFEFTPGCPGLAADGGAGVTGGVAFCAPDTGDNGFSADVTCQNIGGTYHAVYGDAVAGGGLNCGDDISVIYPLLSVSPELPADCTVISFEINDSFDECSIR